MHMHPLKLSLFALLLLAVLGLSQEAEAESVDVYVNHAQLSSESNFSHPNYIPFHMSVHLSEPYAYESEDDNLSVHFIIVNINFLSDTDRRNSCMSCTVFTYYENEEDPGYDEYRTSFYPDAMGFEGYEGPIQIYLILKNRTEVPVWDSSFSIYLFSDSKTNNNLENSNTMMEDNKIIIFAVGIVGLIIAAVVRTRFPTNVDDHYALPKPDDNNYPTSYENDRRSDEIVKQIKTLEESEMDKGTNGDDKFTKLQELKTMYKEGLIDEKEFKKLKKEILD